MRGRLSLLAAFAALRAFSWGPYTEQTARLLIPEETVTSHSAALLWTKMRGENAADSYSVELDGREIARVGVADYTLEGLTPDREYSVKVVGRRNGECIGSCGGAVFRTRKASKAVSILDFGAKGDGDAMNTDAFAKAIAACPKGGTVLVPKGVFKTGAIKLKSDMTLFLEEGSRIVGSTNLVDYPVAVYRAEGRELPRYASLIGNDFDGERLHDIAIAGTGIIDASGRPLRVARDRQGRIPYPGSAICLRNVDRVYIKGVTVRHSPFWCVHFVYCENVSVNGVKIHTKLDEEGRKYRVANCDGIDPDSCRHVAIFNTFIASQDDSIAVKSGRDEEGRKVGVPSEDIRISNVRIVSGGGVAIGSEMSGGVRDVLVQDCEFGDDVYSLANIKTTRSRGGVIENILFENVRHRYLTGEYHDWLWCRGAIYIDQFYACENPDPDKMAKIGPGTATIRNIAFENCTVETVGGNAVYLCGTPESPLSDIRFMNVRAVGKTGIVVHNVQNLDASGLSLPKNRGTWYYKPYEYEAWKLQQMRKEADLGILHFAYPGRFLELSEEPKPIWSEKRLKGFEPISGRPDVPPHRSRLRTTTAALRFADGMYDLGREDIGYVYAESKSRPVLFVGESRAEATNVDTNSFEQSTMMIPCGEGGWRSEIPLALRYFRFETPVESVKFLSQVDWSDPVGRFSCPDARKERIWQIGVETLRLCTRTFLVDGIKRDRLPWAADLAIEVLAEAYSFGDPEPIKRTLSAIGSGKPEKVGNVNGIASFSMWWVIAHDLLQRYFRETEYLKLHYPRIRERMSEMAQHEDERGFFVRDLGWDFIDWTGRDCGQLKSEISRQIIYFGALDAAVRLADRVHDEESAKHWKSKAERLKTAILMSGMDNTRHSRILAISLGLVEGEKARRYAQEIATGGMPPTKTPYMATFEVLALMKGGEKEAAVAKFESVWGSMADAGVDAYWESWDCSEGEDERYAFYNRPFGRSLCHAWSCGPVFLIPGVFLGIEPAEDGWRKIIRSPRCAEFAPDAEVIVPTPDGPKTFKFDVCPKPTSTYVIKPNSEWIPVVNDPWIVRSSALDFSTMRTTGSPAGKHGRIVARNGHFEFEDLPGVSQRFYGINIDGTATTVPRDIARRAAENLARCGYNAVRLMHFKPLIRDDSVTGLDFDDAALDRFDGFVCECIKNGLYLTMDFACFRRTVSWRSIGVDRDGYVDCAEGKTLPWYRHQGFRENYKEYVRRLLSHVNPYTGRSYAEEPAFVWFGYLNEPYSQKGYPKDEWRRILDDERGFAMEMNGFLRREIGSKTLTANNNGLWFPVFLQIPRSAEYDVIDCHYYIEHPDFGDKTWGAPNRLKNENVFKTEAMGGLSIAAHRDFGKPFVVSEWNACAPSSRRMSASVAFPAYAALQGWDGIWRFDWCWDDHGFRWPEVIGVSWFAMCGDPMRRATERAGVAMFLRRDVRPLKDAWSVVIDPDAVDVSQSVWGLSMWRKNFSALGWKCRLGTSVGRCPRGVNVLGTFPAAFTDATEKLAERIGEDGGGEVSVSRSDGTLAISSPRLKCIAAEVGRLGVKGFDVEVSGCPAVVCALSLDGGVLEESRRILVSHLTDLQNDGVEYEDETRSLCLNGGNGRVPQLARAGRAEIKLGARYGRWRVYALGTNGRRREKIPSTRQDGALRFTADIAHDPSAATIEYEVVCED